MLFNSCCLFSAALSYGQRCAFRRANLWKCITANGKKICL